MPFDRRRTSPRRPAHPVKEANRPASGAGRFSARPSGLQTILAEQRLFVVQRSISGRRPSVESYASSIDALAADQPRPGRCRRSHCPTRTAASTTSPAGEMRLTTPSCSASMGLHAPRAVRIGLCPPGAAMRERRTVPPRRDHADLRLRQRDLRTGVHHRKSQASASSHPPPERNSLDRASRAWGERSISPEGGVQLGQPVPHVVHVPALRSLRLRARAKRALSGAGRMTTARTELYHPCLCGRARASSATSARESTLSAPRRRWSGPRTRPARSSIREIRHR